MKCNTHDIDSKWWLIIRLPTDQRKGLFMSYHQLTTEERCDIYVLRKQGLSLSAIARRLGRSRSTISREVERNKGKKGYRPIQAHKKALQRRTDARAHRQPLVSGALAGRVVQELEAGWSPEQIAGRLGKDGSLRVSHETIYRYIKVDKDGGGQLYRLLRHGRRQRKKRSGSHDRRGQIRDRVSIDQRPALVDQRGRTGDWEIDTIVGTQSSGFIVSVVERLTGFVVLGKVARKSSDAVAHKTTSLLRHHQQWVHTITADNGKEFASHKVISKNLQADVYFAHPYHSWERGCNENANGLVRQYFPKSMSFTSITDADCRRVANQLNQRPRKRLGWKTPAEVYKENTGVALLN